MKMPTVSFFLCAMMALTQAAAHPTTTPTMPPMTMIGEGYVFSCPDGWTMVSTRCLLYVPTKMTWAEAEENCRHRGHYQYGSLASVYDSEGSDEIHGMLKSAGHEHIKVWVGGSNTAEDPSWSWSDFMGLNLFHDFCSKKHEHHCLQITFEETEAGCLADMDCKAKLPSVCEIILM